MLKNQWYAVEFGHEVTGTPRQARMFGQDLVLFRDAAGTVVCLSDICIHRGGPLSGGKVVGDCVQCPYHGWEFDPSGACTRIPANRDSVPIPRKARVDSYPTIERYGYVFVFLGDLAESERPPVPQLELLEPIAQANAAGHKVIHGEFHWKANYERVLENAVDIAHTPFVHAGSFGNPDKPEIDDYEVEEIHVDGYLMAMTATVHLVAPLATGVWALLARGKERKPIRTRTGIFLPNLTMLEVNSPVGLIKVYTAAIAVDDNHTISKWTMIRDFFQGDWADKNSYKRNMNIFYEDQPTVEGQRPELVPFDLAAELHVKSDALQLSYRRWRQAMLDRGWGIDEHQVSGPTADRVVRVIPSPARRSHPELANAWVLKELEAQQAHRDRADTAIATSTEGAAS